MSPAIRNTPEVREERYQFVKWIQSLPDDDLHRLVFLDEHGFNQWCARTHARCFKGERASVVVPTVKGSRVTVFLGVSILYGKIFMKVNNFFSFHSQYRLLSKKALEKYFQSF